MISQIHLNGVATYSSAGVRMNDLKTINYIYGANGSGKTTISRVIGNPASFPSCVCTWIPSQSLDCLVYNRDFCEKNFNQEKSLQGVFTLGEENVQLLQQITDKRTDIQTKTQQLNRLLENLEGDVSTTPHKIGKKTELETLEAEFADVCWQQKVKHDAKFKEAFTGVRKDRTSFRDRLVREHTSNKANLSSLVDLELKASTVFGESPVVEEEFNALDCETLSAIENDPLLQKAIVGSNDVDIKQMISELGNADWVNTGQAFFEKIDALLSLLPASGTSNIKRTTRTFFRQSIRRRLRAAGSPTEPIPIGCNGTE